MANQEQLNQQIQSEPETKQETVKDDGFMFLGDPTEKNTVKKSGKIRKFIPLIILGALAVVLIFAAMILPKIINTDGTGEPTTEQKETIKLFNFTGTSAERFEINNQVDKYTFVRKLEKTYYLEEHPDNEIQNSAVLSLLTYFGSLEAVTEVAKDVTDFDQFGLSTPISTVTWTKKDTKHVLEIGDIAASGNYYIRVDGGNTVYTLSKDIAILYCSPRMDFYNPYIYDFDPDNDARYINYFEISRKGQDTIKIRLQDLTDESINSAYVIEAPINHNASADKSDSLIDLVNSLTSCTVYDDDVSENGLKKYGLDAPEISFTFVNVAEKHTFRFSKPTDKGYAYMYEEGGNFIYIVDKSTIEILTFNLPDYCESMAYNRSYDTIDNIVITGGGKKYTIDITGTAENSDLKAYINNKYVEYDNFAELYSHIIGIEIKDIKDGFKENELIATITVNCLDGTKDVLNYYKQSDLDTYYQLNGKGNIVVSTAKAEQIIEFAQKLYDGEEIITEW